MRTNKHVYTDPLDVIWLDAARRMGMRVVRSSEVFAAWDGQGTLTIGTAETLDPDDSLAQMILHETCHALIEGPDAFHQPDWGVRLDLPQQRVREHACLRLQAALTQPFGLRQFFAATTMFRRYYDDLPTDAMEGDDDPAVPIARRGLQRAHSGPWSSILQLALLRTRTIAECVLAAADEDSLWATYRTDGSD